MVETRQIAAARILYVDAIECSMHRGIRLQDSVRDGKIEALTETGTHPQDGEFGLATQY
jgi:hypothetical protein